MSNAETSFRESLKAFTTKKNSSSYLPVPQLPDLSYDNLVNFNRTKDDFCGLTRIQRLFGFIITLGLSAFCFSVAFFTLPMVVISPAKFAISYTFASLLAFCSFCLIKGFRSYFNHIFSKERLPFTGSYLASMGSTLYFALVAHNYVLIILSSVIQMCALVWYFGSYLPGGVSGLSAMTKWFARGSGLPV